jgi:hypothetical protein
MKEDGERRKGTPYFKIENRGSGIFIFVRVPMFMNS